jgi:hypothetical protein
MRPDPFQPSNASQTKLTSACNPRIGDPPDIIKSLEPAVVSDATRNGAGEDAILLALGGQFEEIADQLDNLSGNSDENLEQIEALLVRLDPVERSILAAPARTMRAWA